MADRIDAVVDPVQAPIPNPPVDLPAAHAQGEQLLARDPRVLPPRFAGGCVEYSPHTVQ